MKLLLLAGLIAVSVATPLYKGKNVVVEEDGSIVITGESGKQVVISKELGINGQKNLGIVVSGPNIPTKRIEINDTPYGTVGNVDIDLLPEYEDRLKRTSSFSSTKGKYSVDALPEVIREYQNVVDEVTYDKLLKKVDKSVKKGELDASIYDLLGELDRLVVENPSVVKEIEERIIQIGGAALLSSGQGYLGGLYGGRGQYAGNAVRQYGGVYGSGAQVIPRVFGDVSRYYNPYSVNYGYDNPIYDNQGYGSVPSSSVRGSVGKSLLGQYLFGRQYPVVSRGSVGEVGLGGRGVVSDLGGLYGYGYQQPYVLRGSGGYYNPAAQIAY